MLVELDPPKFANHDYLTFIFMLAKKIGRLQSNQMDEILFGLGTVMQI
jgi:hypothetical protein